MTLGRIEKVFISTTKDTSFEVDNFYFTEKKLLINPEDDQSMTMMSRRFSDQSQSFKKLLIAIYL